MSLPRGSIARTSLALLPMQVVFRSVEAAMPVVLAAWFGRSEWTDVYYFGWAVFALAGSLVFSAFHDSAVVPVLAETRLRDPALLPAVRGSLLAHTLAAGGTAAIAFGALTSACLALRYTGHARALALAMSVPWTLYVVTLAVKTLYGSILNAERLYAPLAIASATGAVVAVVVVAALRGTLSVVAIPCGSLAGELAAVGWLAATALSARIAITPTFARPEPVRRMIRLVASEVGGGAVTRLNPVVDQLLAGLAGVVGGGTMLKLSGDVAMVPTSLVQAALLPVLLTHWSEDFASHDLAAGDVRRLRATVRRTLVSVAAILAVASAVLAAARGPLLRLVFAHGAMDAAGVERMATIFPFHLLGLAPFGALLVLVRAHVAAQNSRIMLSMGVLNAALNAALDVALLPVLGLQGIALATSLTYGAVAVVLFFRLESRLARRHDRGATASAAS